MIVYINDCIWIDFKNLTHVHHIYLGFVHIQIAYIACVSLYFQDNIFFLLTLGKIKQVDTFIEWMQRT
jgi:hypothetical protein